MQAEALLVCSCGMWGLGVNDCLEYGVYFSWVLLWNEFAIPEQNPGEIKLTWPDIEADLNFPKRPCETLNTFHFPYACVV